VLTNGRCLPTCSKSQYFDTTSSTCQTCDSNCSSCSGSGPSNCLACSSSNQVLRSGSCVAANCQGSSSVIPALGVCLSELIEVPRSSGTGSPVPLPSITGLADPTVVSVNRRLEWWQILLMALGCAFIFMMILWCWRRKARKQREKRTKEFARVKKLDGPQKGWKWRLVRFGEKLFGHKKSKLQHELPVSYNHHDTALSRPQSRISDYDIKLRNFPHPISDKKDISSFKSPSESHRKRETMDDILSAYEYSVRSEARFGPSILPSLDERRKDDYTRRLKARVEQSSHSLYSEVTGNQRMTPEPRQPVKKDPVSSRASIGTSIFVPALAKKLTKRNEKAKNVLVDLDDSDDHHKEISQPLQKAHPSNNDLGMTEAQAYMMAVRPGITGKEVSSQQPLPPFYPIPTFAPLTNTVSATATTPIINTNPNGGSLIPIQVTLTPNTTGGQGSYWLTPVVMPRTQLQQTQVSQQPLRTVEFSDDTVVLQPQYTGTSAGGSNNPFRKGSY